MSRGPCIDGKSAVDKVLAQFFLFRCTQVPDAQIDPDIVLTPNFEPPKLGHQMLTFQSPKEKRDRNDLKALVATSIVQL